MIHLQDIYDGKNEDGARYLLASGRISQEEFDRSYGSLASAECSPNNVMKRALLCSAATVILAHNHPSGDAEPSHDDIVVCENIKEAGKLIGIKLDDFIVIGGDEYYSFFEEKLF